MNFAVLQFPASNCDQDAIHALRDVLNQSARYVWHKDTSVGNADVVIVPGGFSYGDYLRCGAIARFSPVMQAVKQFADNGGLVLGVCNGFQVLTEAGLLPGALVRNRDLQFHCEHIFLKTATADSPFTNKIPAGKFLKIPIAHGEGCYFADEETLAKLKANNQVLWQYCDANGNLTDAANPNGSLLNVAGICNERRNVAGLMPHPERACEEILGSADGRFIFESLLSHEPPKSPFKDTPIELKLLDAIHAKGRLPEPTKQLEYKKGGSLITIPDFAYETEKIAIYCDGFTYHGNKETLASDSKKRNELQADGWIVLTFWGKTITKDPDGCEEQIWQAWKARKTGTN